LGRTLTDEFVQVAGASGDSVASAQSENLGGRQLGAASRAKMARQAEAEQVLRDAVAAGEPRPWRELADWLSKPT
jgi:hypothetical protein